MLLAWGVNLRHYALVIELVLMKVTVALWKKHHNNIWNEIVLSFACLRIHYLWTLVKLFVTVFNMNHYLLFVSCYIYCSLPCMHLRNHNISILKCTNLNCVLHIDRIIIHITYDFVYYLRVSVCLVQVAYSLALLFRLSASLRLVVDKMISIMQSRVVLLTTVVCVCVCV